MLNKHYDLCVSISISHLTLFIILKDCENFVNLHLKLYWGHGVLMFLSLFRMRHLICIKLVFLFQSASMTVLYPYINLHMKSLGRCEVLKLRHLFIAHIMPQV